MRLLSGMLAVLVMGCSFAKTARLPVNYKAPAAVACEASKTPPTFDLVLGLLLAGGAAAIAFTPSPPADAPAIVGTNLVTGLAFIGSSVYGFRNTSACETAQLAHRRDESRLLMERKAIPRVPSTIRIVNGGMECLVALRVDYLQTNDEEPTWAPVRLAAQGDWRFEIKGRPGHAMLLEGAVTVLGQTYSLGQITEVFVPGSELTVFIDYDTALGRHRMRAGWTKPPEPAAQ